MIKLFPAAVLAMALGTAAFARAQDDEPESSPTPKINLRASDSLIESEPAVSIPTERSSTTYPKPGTPLKPSTPAATLSPSPVTTPVTTRKTSPTPSPTASPARITPTPAAAATPRPASRGSIETTVRELENRWLAAIKAKDTAAVQALLADNYIGVSATGRVVTKAALLADMKRDKNSYDTAVNSGLTVRVHGDTAVVVGTTRQAGKDAAGQAFNYTYRWTDTWALCGGTWQCVASQSIQVAR
ncbi:hypothetical protein BH20VER1_BH20VER1_02890 [soil metagenome]